MAGTPVLLSAYPAGFLGGIETDKNLWLTVSPSVIEKLYYFNEASTTDLFSVKGNIVSQKGASGGAVMSLILGNLLGVITTATDSKMTSDRDLTAITTLYVKKVFEKESGQNLNGFLSTPMETLVKNFNENMSTQLTKLLVEALDKN